MRAVLLLFVAVALASAETTQITGRVLDPSGAGVPEARVSAVARASGALVKTVADAAGSYTIGGLGAGEYLVEAHAPGLGSSKPERLTLAANQEHTLDITLMLQSVATQVQVTASGGAQSVDEQAKALTVIDSQQLTDRAEYSVADALRDVPGIRVQQLGGPGAMVRILSRGLRAYDTSVLIDGFRLRDAASPQGEATSLIGDLLLAGTERIEVLRGSGSSLYGTHATGGVVNIITAPGTSGFHGEIGAEGGGLGLLRGITRASGSALDERLRFGAGATHLNVIRGVDGNDRARNSLVHGLVQYRLGARTELTARIMANNSFAQLNDSPFAAQDLPQDPVIKAIPGVTFIPAPDDPDDSRAAGFFSGLFALSHSWSPTVSTRLSYQGVNTRRDNRDGPGGMAFQPEHNSSYLFDGRIDTLQARSDFRVARNWITAGYEWEHENFDNLTTDQHPVSPVNARLRMKQASHAVFAQDQIQLLDRHLQISLSGRLQDFQLHQPRFSDDTSVYRNVRLQSPPLALTGDLAVAYFSQRTGTKIRAHAGNGYRIPALYERFGGAFFGSFGVYGDPMLRPERVLAVDTGLDQYLGSRTRISTTFFYTRIQEAIIFDFSGVILPETDPYGRFGGYRNTAGGLARGLELSIETNPSRNSTLRSSYTYTNADERHSLFNTGNLKSVRTPDHMFTTSATQRFGRVFDATLDLFSSSSSLMVLEGRAFEFEGPLKADLAFNYTRPLTDTTSLRFFTRVENFLNRAYYEDGFRAPRAWATAGMRFLF
jgi:vitamin B12 transporter